MAAPVSLKLAALKLIALTLGSGSSSISNTDCSLMGPISKADDTALIASTAVSSPSLRSSSSTVKLVLALLLPARIVSWLLAS